MHSGRMATRPTWSNRPCDRGSQHRERSNGPFGFRLVAQTDTEFAFENPTHDFPHRITYLRTAADSFTATIAGPGEDGESQEIAFHFTR